MTWDRKQKTMLGVLSVLVVGMGGVWYAMSGSNSGAAKIATSGPFVRYPRAKPVDSEKTKVKRRDPARPRTAGPRRGRDAVDTRGHGPKNRRGVRGPKVKKKDSPPQA